MKHEAFAFLSLSTLLYSQGNQVTIQYANSPLANPTQIDYTDILGKDSLLNSSDIAKSLQQIPGFSVAKKGGGGTEAFFLIAWWREIANCRKWRDFIRRLWW